MTTATTSAELIRDNAAAIMESLTLSVLQGTSFERTRGEVDFREWARTNANACLRRFSVELIDAEELGEVSDEYIELSAVPFELVIAYPYQLGLYGEDNERDLEDTIASDLRQLKGQVGIGLNNSGDYVAGLHALIVEEDTIEREEPVWFSVLTLSATYHRSVSA